MTLVTVDDKGHKRCLQSHNLSGETPVTTSAGPAEQGVLGVIESPFQFLDLKKGPKNFKSLLEKFEASLSPKILNTIKNIKIMKNCTKYLIDFIF